MVAHVHIRELRTIHFQMEKSLRTMHQCIKNQMEKIIKGKNYQGTASQLNIEISYINNSDMCNILKYLE